MTKLIKIISSVFYFSVLYILTFIYVAFFNLSAEALNEWKRSEFVAVFPEQVDITGENRLTEREILLISGLDQRRSWFDLDERKIESFLMSSGWVKKASAKKLFPDSVKIVVEEYLPFIVVNSRKKSDKDNIKKDLNTMWFADEEGIVFKKAFPGETDISLPVFHIDYESVSEKQREFKIKSAVQISKEWKKASSICSIRSIRYDISSGFTADCESEDSLMSVIHYGPSFSDEEIENMKEMFLKYSGKLSAEKKWAGEYIFEKAKKDNKIRVIVGKVFQNVNRGNDA